MHRSLFVALLGLSTLVLSGCCMQVRVCCKTRCCPKRATPAPEAGPTEVPEAKPAEMPEAAPQARPEALYDGNAGKPESLLVAADSWQDADLVAFGELHGHPVGARHQLALLKAMAEQDRPVAMAMEFLERDDQAAVDAYLAGEIDHETFQKRAGMKPPYGRTHGPLMEYCKDHDIPVIAANAPRRLVSAYRKQDEDYETWKASLPAADQAFLPEETSVLDDEYSAKFMRLMGEARGTSFFRSQSLWDDSMAEAMVDFKADHPDHRILFIVGAFHVTKGLGTITKYRMRRGKDEVRILTMTMDADPSLGFKDHDLGLGDLVLKVPQKTRARRKHGTTPKAAPKATKAPQS